MSLFLLLIKYKNVVIIKFMDYCNEHGISHNFYAPRTPQQNGVVERKIEH